MYIQSVIFSNNASVKFWEIFFNFITGKDYAIFPQYDYIVIFIIVITVIAYVLQIITRPIFLIFEGYWSDLIPNQVPRIYYYVKKFEDRFRKKKRDQWRSLRDQFEQLGEGTITDPDRYRILHNILSTQFPPREEEILPTYFGNYLLSAEKYASLTYGMDVIFWWPRIWLILSDAEREEIEETLTPIITLLNAIFFLVIGAIWTVFFIIMQIVNTAKFSSHTVWTAGCEIFVLLGLVGIIYALYQFAIMQTLPYGDNIRAVVDLHRFDLLKSLHQKMPPDIKEEKTSWKKLEEWVWVQNFSSAEPYEHYEK